MKYQKSLLRIMAHVFRGVQQEVDFCKEIAPAGDIIIILGVGDGTCTHGVAREASST